MKTTVTAMALVCMVLSASLAQETKYISGGIAREMALGGSPTNAYIMDYTNVLTNPAWAVKYGDLIYSELGYNFAGFSASGQSVGFTYAISSGLALGLHVGSQEGPMFVNNSYGALVGGNVIYSDDFISGVSNLAGIIVHNTIAFPSSADWRPWQVYGAFKVGGLMLGAAFYRIGWSSSGDVTATTQEEISFGQTGLKVGTLIDMNLFMLDASALLRFNSATAKNTLPSPQISSEVNATGTEFALNARLFMKLSDKFTFVPIARFSTFGYAPEISMPVATGNRLNSKPSNYGRTEFEIGAGANINVTGGRVYAGVSFETMSLKNEVTEFTNFAFPTTLDSIKTKTTKYTTSLLSFPKVTLGGEFDLASWLTGRVGYFKSFSTLTETVEAPGAKKQELKSTIDFMFLPAYNTIVSNDQLLSVGLGFHFDRFSLDGYLCEAWLADGPYIASGISNAMFGILSMSYNFH